MMFLVAEFWYDNYIPLHIFTTKEKAEEWFAKHNHYKKESKFFYKNKLTNYNAEILPLNVDPM